MKSVDIWNINKSKSLLDIPKIITSHLPASEISGALLTNSKYNIIDK
jgi:hypothetical protein